MSEKSKYMCVEAMKKTCKEEFRKDCFLAKEHEICDGMSIECENTHQIVHCAKVGKERNMNISRKKYRTIKYKKVA